MGDRFYLTLKCAYCGLESKVYYAPTCNFFDFTCQTNTDEELNLKTGCRKINFICADFSVKKVEDISEENVVDAFDMASTAGHTRSNVTRLAKLYIKELKKRLQATENKE